ncbi:MAG TPA: ABC transporter permease, partial [Acinetobacter sp.]|nr:ABC transporter permease [Acinetobacter sp.]
MSPMIQTRLQRFRQNRLGFLCFILFSLIFAVSLAANLIANEKPLLVKYQQSFYFPVFKSYPETTFGGVFETEADYKDPVVQQLIADQGWAVWPVIRYAAQTPNLDLA